MKSVTITRNIEVLDLSDYQPVNEFELKISESSDETVNQMKELMLKLSSYPAWGTLLLDMTCLKAAGRSNWQQPIAHLLPVLKRHGSDEQAEQALSEFAADNAPVFTDIESFEWLRVGGLYWEPQYWWGYLKQFETPELKQAFWDKMQEIWEEWTPITPEEKADFAELEKAYILEGLDNFTESFIRIDVDTAEPWYIEAIKARGIEIKETVAAMLRREAKERALKIAPCEPTFDEPLDFDEYLKRFDSVESSDEMDSLGIKAFLDMTFVDQPADRKKFMSYLRSRLVLPESPLRGRMLEATTAEAIYSSLERCYQNRKWAIEVEEAPIVDKEEVFNEALDSANFETVFAEAETYKDLILENIDEIAGNFCGENGFEATGEEPQWLLSALLKAGAEFGSGGSDDDDDDEILFEKQPIEPVVEQKKEAPKTGFTGKRVCITGKLEVTRDVWEAWVKDAGGTPVSSVSKTTDFLIAAAGSQIQTDLGPMELGGLITAIGSTDLETQRLKATPFSRGGVSYLDTEWPAKDSTGVDASEASSRRWRFLF